MDRVPVRSSNIRSIGCDPGTQILEIEFHSGRIYHYFEVPESVYRELMSSISKGSYLHACIKDRYAYKCVR